MCACQAALILFLPDYGPPPDYNYMVASQIVVLR